MSSHFAVHNEVLPDGTTLALELNLEEDVEEELHHFVRLSRKGNYSGAQAFFDRTLAKYGKLFPAIAEYADMLLDQGRYGQAAEFLSHNLAMMSKDAPVNEIQLLRLMKSLADAYSKGALRSALLEAQRAWELLTLQYDRLSEDPPIEVQVHTFEVYVNIIVLGLQSSQWVDERWIRCPFSRPTSETRNSFVHWYCVLRDKGLLWEASRILRALLPIISILPADDAQELLDDNLPHPLKLSASDVWASLTIPLHHAHYLLNYVLASRILVTNSSAADDIYAKAKKRLNAAEQIWSMLASEEDLEPLHLPLALEKISFELVEAGLSSQPASSDSLSALSRLLTDADLRHDLRNQILARIYILVVECGTIADWRDLYSIFELQIVDCGNFVDYAQIWELLAAWTLEAQLPFKFLPRSPVLGLNRSALLLSLYNPRISPSIGWTNLLVQRSLFSQSIDVCEGDSLTFNQTAQEYALAFDIPAYTISHKLLQQQLLVYPEENKTANPQTPSIESSRIVEMQTLAGHLGLPEERTLESDSSGHHGEVMQQSAGRSAASARTETSDQALVPSGTESLPSTGRSLVVLSEAEDYNLRSNDANLDSDQSESLEKEETLRQSLADKENELGTSHMSTLDVVYSLGSFYEKQGRLNSAEGMYQRAVTGYCAALPPDHLTTLKAKNNLGRVCNGLGKLNQAERLLREALSGKATVLGLAHHSTLRTLNNLGTLFQDQGRLVEAEMALRTALIEKARHLGFDHPSTLRAKNDLMQLYRNQGRVEEAMQVAEAKEAREIFQLASNVPTMRELVGKLATRG